jgi:Uncharacterized protein conserved in bacteria
MLIFRQVISKIKLIAPVFKFITKKPLWVHILVAVGLLFLLVFIFLLSLDWMTEHGKTLTIPSVTGKSYDQAVKELENQGFEVVLQDSVYIDTARPLQVMRQFPEADATVKRNRTVWLTINRAVPPLIEMPKLDGLSYRSAEMVVRQNNLNIEDTIYRVFPGRDVVIDQLYNGEPIKPGTKIHMGSSIVLVLGSGVGNEEFKVPDLFGLTLAEAQVYLESMGLLLGVVIPPDLKDDPNKVYVKDQEPKPLTPDGRPNSIRRGQSIDLFVQTQKPVRIDSNLNSGQDEYE